MSAFIALTARVHADHHAFAARTLFELAPRLGSALALSLSHDSQIELVLYPQKSMRDQLSNVTIFACLRKLRSTCSLLCLAIAAYSLLRSACNLLCLAIAACSLLRSACNLLCLAIAACSLLRSACSLLCFAIAACSLLRSACNLLCFAIAACSLLVRDGRKPRGRSRVGFDVVEAQRAYL